MSLRKQFLKKKDICKVTFRVSADEANGEKNARLLGSFNNWKPEKMTPLKDGSFKLVKDLEKDNDYTFRYLVGKDLWLNDSEADRFSPSQFIGTENAILSV